MNFKQWVIDLFKDERGSTSVKPVIAFVGAMFLCVTMMINSFSHADFAPSPELVNAVMIITGIGSLIHIFSIGYMHDDKGFYKFFTYLNLF